MNEPDIESIKKNLHKKIKRDKNIFLKYPFLKYAAVILLTLSIGHLYVDKNGIETTEIVSSPTLIPKEESVIIQLDNGTEVVLDANNEQNI